MYRICFLWAGQLHPSPFMATSSVHTLAQHTFAAHFGARVFFKGAST